MLSSTMMTSFGILAFGSRMSVRNVATSSLRPKKFTSILEKVPTKPRSSWQIYMRDQLIKYKNSDGKVDMSKATAELGEKWRAMSETDKKQYLTLFEKEAKAHDAAVKDALERATPQQFRDENTLRRKYKLPLLKDPKAPKKPVNVYMTYLSHLRTDGPPAFRQLSVAEQAKEGARMYRNLNPQEKAPFEKASKAHSERYYKELAAYEEAGGSVSVSRSHARK